MGLAYFILFGMILGAVALAIISLKAAWEIWKGSQWKVMAVFPVLLAVLCFGVAFYLIAIIWKEPPWGFHF